jgi:lipid-binding SYLF domain-containing protein
MRRILSILATPLLVTGLFAAAPVQASGNPGHSMMTKKASGVRNGQLPDAKELVRDSAATVKQMKADPQMKKLLAKAKGVFIVPSYAKGGMVVGARGGQGVMLAHRDGRWSSPAFYNLAGISVGAQAGFEAGAVAMVLMSQKAVDSFESGNTFSLNADADLTIINWSGRGQASLGKGGDVVVWSDSEGAFAGADFSATDISWADEENAAFYGRSASAQQILTSQVTNPLSNKLRKVLPS